MVGAILYNIIELINFYVTYRNVFGISFVKKRIPYVLVIVISCIVQLLVWYLVDHTWRDTIAFVMGLVGAIVLTESRKGKTILLYPVVVILSSFINLLGSYGVAGLLGTSQEAVGNSVELTLVSECAGIIVFTIYGLVFRKKRQELSFTWGQYLVLIVGGVCFFITIAFSQGLLYEEIDVKFLSRIKDATAIASMLIACLFILLCICQHITWKRVLQYRIENERYEVFLTGQEEYIRMLIIEDENRRRLRHDMNAHMLALNIMAEREEWSSLREYLGQMKESYNEAAVNKYTLISAVDAIIDRWHNQAMECQALWSWEGTLNVSEEVTVFELCTVFSNLLSNAVEAVASLEGERQIKVQVSNFQGKIVISLGNTCDKGQKSSSRPQTTKEDKTSHGLGLKNVEEIIKKHEGSINYSKDNGWFQVDLVL